MCVQNPIFKKKKNDGKEIGRTLFEQSPLKYCALTKQHPSTATKQQLKKYTHSGVTVLKTTKKKL